MMQFFQNVFKTSKKDNQDLSESLVEQTNYEREYDNPQKQCQTQKQVHQIKQDDDMDKLSRRQRKRDFKLAIKASNYLQQSIMANNRNHQKDLNLQKKSSEDNTYEQIIPLRQYANHQDKQYEDSKNNSQINGNEFENQWKNKLNRYDQLKNQILKYDSILNKRQNDVTKSRKVTFLDQQQTGNFPQNYNSSIGTRKMKQKENTASINWFINESEIFKASTSKADTIYIRSQEAIQNNYLESVFISEDEFDDEENRDDLFIDDDVVDDNGIIDIEQHSNQDVHSTCLEQPILECSSQKEKGIEVIQHQQSFILGDMKKQESVIKEKQKRYIKRKRNEMLAVPDEFSSFELTLQKGRSKQFSQRQNVNALNLSMEILNEQSLIHNNCFSDSKSNLNNVIQNENKKSIASLLQNCSDIYSFSQMTTNISRFQYKKQEIFIHHQLSDFHFISKIGEGSFGKVDLYEYVPLKFAIAVKSVNTLEEFARELYLMESLQSTYMPQLFYYDETQLKLFMEVGLCSLEDYRQYSLTTQQYINDDQAFAILSQIIIAVEILLDQKAFHGDIKPQNILIRTTIDSNSQIQIQLMLIDYGGASFDLEDYWIYYTPAFVCIPLWEKIIASNQLKKDQNESKIQEINQFTQDIQNLGEENFMNNDNNSDNKQRMKTLKVKQNLINPIYQVSPRCTNNLRDIDQRAIIYNCYSKKEGKGYTLERDDSAGGINDSTKSNPTENNNQADETNRTNQASTFQSEFQLLNLSPLHYNIKKAESSEFKGYSQHSNSPTIKQENHYQFQEIKKQQSNDIKSTNHQTYQGIQQITNNLPIQNGSCSLGQKIEYLSGIQKQLDSIKNGWTKTQSLNFDTNNEKNAQDQWLTWEEIRYSEVYAGCRCVQYLMLRKEDQQEMFKQKNIEKFMIKYLNLYPKTLKLMYKIYFKINTHSLTKDQLNSLFLKNKEEDYSIKMDPNLLLKISPLQKQLSKIKDQSV